MSTILGGVIVFFIGVVVFIAKTYKFGPFLETKKHEELEPTAPPEPIPDAKIPPPEPVLPPVDGTAMLELFCSGIKQNEGFIAPGGKDWSGKVYPLGSRSYQNNSPGNFRCSPEGYLAKYGVVRCIDGFARFSSYAIGEDYLLNSVRHKAEKNPEWTILDFFTHYAPKSDGNDPIAYANFIANWCKVPVHTKVAVLFGEV